jgi:hypothetical protein
MKVESVEVRALGGRWLTRQETTIGMKGAKGTSSHGNKVAPSNIHLQAKVREMEKIILKLG